MSYEIEDEETCDRSEISLYGADHLLEYQNGYAWNTESGEVFEDWNPDFVVIADTEADPFCIDISREDSPVYFAEHGMGEWEFDEYCDSLEEFLKEIGAAEGKLEDGTGILVDADGNKFDATAMDEGLAIEPSPLSAIDKTIITIYGE